MQQAYNKHLQLLTPTMTKDSCSCTKRQQSTNLQDLPPLPLEDYGLEQMFQGEELVKEAINQTLHTHESIDMLAETKTKLSCFPMVLTEQQQQQFYG